MNVIGRDVLENPRYAGVMFDDPVTDGAEVVKITTGSVATQTGTAGLSTQVGGQPTTVSSAADATGGIGAGNFVQPDIDEELFRFQGEDTPLMQLMLKAKKIKVNSPEVIHYMLDEERASFYTTAALTPNVKGSLSAQLPVGTEDAGMVDAPDTLLVKGVKGYEADGATESGMPLLLVVTGVDTTTGYPVVRAVNGKKNNKNDAYSLLPTIPAGTKVIVLSNTLYETQKKVKPSSVVPRPMQLYLQKRGMNHVVSDYFDAQKKAIPFADALIAEQEIKNFKIRGNRTLWASCAGKFKVDTPEAGMQYAYTTTGVRWQFKKELKHTGKWTIEELIALAKMGYTGEDVPNSLLLLAGKNLLEQIQCIDYSKHPEVKIETKHNPAGWEVTSIHTVFGDIQIKHEPTLNRLGWSNSGALIAQDRLVHYVYKNESQFNDDVEGEEAKRSGILVWDGLALKGSCHIWIDGDDAVGTQSADEAKKYLIWNESTINGADMTEGYVYYLLSDTTGTNGDTAAASTVYRAGTMIGVKNKVIFVYSGEFGA